MPARDRRANIGLIDADYAASIVEERRASGHLPAYRDRLGFYIRPHVQWSKYPKDRAALYVAADFTCAECGYRPAADLIPEPYDGTNTVGDLVVDHIVSLRDGGARFDPANLRVLCKHCNGSKG